jgi:hypothetical protein
MTRTPTTTADGTPARLERLTYWVTVPTDFALECGASPAEAHAQARAASAARPPGTEVLVYRRRHLVDCDGNRRRESRLAAAYVDGRRADGGLTPEGYAYRAQAGEARARSEHKAAIEALEAIPSCRPAARRAAHAAAIAAADLAHAAATTAKQARGRVEAARREAAHRAELDALCPVRD